MNGTTTIVEEESITKNGKKPGPLRSVTWSENVDETELEIPGTPRTPRTSTTPGIKVPKIIFKTIVINCDVE